VCRSRRDAARCGAFAGIQRGLLVGSIFVLASAVIALRATNTRGESEEAPIEAEPQASLAA